MHFSWRQLSLFEAVARHRSYTRAAEELHLTQPAVSIQVKQLEDTIGLPLFEQIGKRIYLTEAGEDLRVVCREILDAIGRFEMSIAERKGLRRGRLQLAATTTAKYFVPRLLGPFCERYPGVDVALKVTNQERLLERLHENLDDLYIIGRPPQGISVVAEPFLENRLVLLAYPDHPLVGQCNILPERVAEEPFLMREQGSGTRAATEWFFRELGLAPRIRMELGSNEAIKQGVMGKLGLAVLSQNTVTLECETRRLESLDVNGFPLIRQWHIVHRSDKTLSIVAQAFRDYLTGLQLSNEKGNAGIVSDPEPAVVASALPKLT